MLDYFTLYPSTRRARTNDCELYQGTNLDLINSYSENFTRIDIADVRSIKQGILVDDNSDTG
jgi:hypothetical protein